MPVWPICFWSIWPLVPPIRLPNARIPMSFIATPPSFSAARAASAARSTVSSSGCLPNLVMWIPRIQTSPVAMVSLLLLVRRENAICSGRLEAESDGLGACLVDADRERREAHLHAELHVVGVGLGVDDVGAHARAVAVDDRG